MAVPVLVLAVIAGVTALAGLTEPPSWLSWCPPWLSATVAAVLGVLGTWWAEPWAERRQAEAEKERQAVERLRKYLGGRVQALPRLGEPGAKALALRVHEAIPISQPGAGAATSTVPAPLSQPRGSRPSRWGMQRGPDRDGIDVDLPKFVDRDIGPVIRQWLQSARRSGGFLLLVGNSSVGKTRLLYEAACAALPDFAVLAPDRGDGDLVNKVAEAAFPLPKLIMWLDELQRFLDGPYLDRQRGETPITAAAVRQLLDNTQTPVIILGTMWPEHAIQLRATEPDPVTDGRRPRHPGAADILDGGRVQEKTLESFSNREREAAAKLASADPRLAQALADRDYNVTEVLAGAPQLDRRYKQADEEQKAVLNAAIDARRVGIQAPLTDRLLGAAARGYLTTVHSDDSWFLPALTEVTRQELATAPLIPVLTADRRSVAGYTVADYLLQRLTRERRSRRLSAVTWQAFCDHTQDRDDMMRLADSAAARLLYRYAEPLYRRLVDAGDQDAAERLADLLASRGQVEELQARADAGDQLAAERLADALAARGDLEELQARADAHDSDAAERLAELLANRGDVEGLQARADANDSNAAFALAELLANRGDVEGLQARADVGDSSSAIRLADVLAARDVEQLRARADVGDSFAAIRFAELLAARRDVEGLRARADAGDSFAASRLADVLATRGDVEGLRARAEAGASLAASRLAEVLAARGDVEGLRARADAGDSSADYNLAMLLVDRDIEQLRARADAGDSSAAIRFAEVLAARGDVEGLRARADAGDSFAAMRLAELLAYRGEVQQLRARTDTGDWMAADQLVRLLAARGDRQGVEEEIFAGNSLMVGHLVHLWYESDQDVAEFNQRLRQLGLDPEGSIADRASGSQRSQR
jgi:hypothetical protein